MVGKSDRKSAEVDDLKFTVGEGPCHDALRTGRPVHSSDLSVETRWPHYCRAAQAHGVLSVHAFPLQVGAVSLGVLDVYDARVRVLDEQDGGLALAYADIATESLLHGTHADASFIDPGLRTALGSRARIYQALGMVTVDNNISLAEAMVNIRALAYENRRPISDVARDIVLGALVIPVDAGSARTPSPA